MDVTQNAVERLTEIQCKGKVSTSVQAEAGGIEGRRMTGVWLLALVVGNSVSTIDGGRE